MDMKPYAGFIMTSDDEYKMMKALQQISFERCDKERRGIKTEDQEIFIKQERSELKIVYKKSA